MTLVLTAAPCGRWIRRGRSPARCVIEGERIAALDAEPARRRADRPRRRLRAARLHRRHVHFPTWAVTRRELQLHGTLGDEVLARVAEAVPRRARRALAARLRLDGRRLGAVARGARRGRAATCRSRCSRTTGTRCGSTRAALAHAGGDLERPGGEVDLEAGVLREEAAWSFRDRFTLRDARRSSSRPRARRCRWPPPAASPRSTARTALIGSREVYAELRDELPFRVWQSLPAKRLDERPDYVKAYMDGTLGSRTARLLDGSGVEITSREEFEEIVRAATARGRAGRRARDRRPRQPRRARRVRGACPMRDPRRGSSTRSACTRDDLPRFARARRDRLDPAVDGGHRRAGRRAAVGRPARRRLRVPLAARVRRAARARLRRAGRGDGPAARACATRCCATWRPHEALDLAGRARGAHRHARLARAATRTAAAGCARGCSPTSSILDRDPFDDLAGARGRRHADAGRSQYGERMTTLAATEIGSIVDGKPRRRRAGRPPDLDEPRQHVRDRRRGAARRRRPRSSTPAAPRAPRRSEWAAVPAPARGRVIANVGRLVEANKEALSRLVTREVGKPYAESLGEVQEIIDTCDFFIGEGRRLYGQTVPVGDAEQAALHVPHAGRRRRDHHRRQLPGRRPGLVPRAGDPVRQRGRLEAGRVLARARRRAGQALPRRRRARRRAQRRAGRGRGDLRGPRARARASASSTRSASPARARSARRSASCAAATCSRRAWSSAARTRWS